MPSILRQGWPDAGSLYKHPAGVLRCREAGTADSHPARSIGCHTGCCDM